MLIPAVESILPCVAVDTRQVALATCPHAHVQRRARDVQINDEMHVALRGQ